MISNREQAWIFQQLEPDMIIRTGNHKEHKQINVVYSDIPQDKRTVEEIEAMEDEYLKSKGIC